MDDIFDQIEHEKDDIAKTMAYIKQLKEWEEIGLPLNLTQNHLKVAKMYYNDRLSVPQIAEKMFALTKHTRHRLETITNTLNYYINNRQKLIESGEIKQPEPYNPKFEFELIDIIVDPTQTTPETVNQLLNTRVEYLGLSVRLTNVFGAAGITILGELFNLNNISELFKVRNFGKQCAVELESFLATNGLKFISEENLPAYFNSVKTLPKFVMLSTKTPVITFAWSQPLLPFFEELNITTIEHLLQKRYELIQLLQPYPTHVKTIQQQFINWGLKNYLNK